ncbi:major histocompatibility complex class I-related gene protein-like [Centropristis striata]|uniref:major histocompatibility complex class I-related gene protein-like n=1 Tax=Centropristis striata TaxID=184440 RepID=UPI0027E20B6F|nr:major histocompatibility complex class I-related gene protein-like [Centropristis striata]
MRQRSSETNAVWRVRDLSSDHHDIQKAGPTGCYMLVVPSTYALRLRTGHNSHNASSPSPSAKHSLVYYFMLSSGVPDFPDYVVSTNVDKVIVAYHDSNMKTYEHRQAWVRKLIKDDPEYWNSRILQAMDYHQLFKAETDPFKLHSNESGGVHINQQIAGCEWDDETEKVDGYNLHAYNGEDFISFDMETETWIALNPRAQIIKEEWDKNKDNNVRWKNYLDNICPMWLKKYLKYGQSDLKRTDLPSVSLLQKTPSSPVSCHTTGFYPGRAMMFWRKDGEELHEDVDLGEILPNPDGSFQMTVDLNLSSVTPEDWTRYECVFQFSGVKEDSVTRLDKAVIRTNWVETVFRTGNEEPSNRTPHITAAVVVVVAAVVVAAVGFVVYKKKKANRPQPPPVELAEKLNPET